MTCRCCHLETCDGVLSTHQIRLSERFAYSFNGCEIQAKRLQYNEDLRRQQLTTDYLEGLRRLNRVPERFREKTAGAFVSTPTTFAAHQAIVSLIRDFKGMPRSVLMIGPVGSGKTHLGCAAVNELTVKGVECRYFYAPDLLDILRSAIRDSTIRDLTFNEFYKLPLLVVDDIGIDHDTAWTVSVYTKIIDGRYRSQKPTVLATNLELSELQMAIGERSMSRIAETFEIVRLETADWRLK